MDPTSRELYTKLVACIKQNEVVQSNRLITELKRAGNLRSKKKLLNLFKYTKSRRIPSKIRQSLITDLMQPILADLEFNTKHPLWICAGFADYDSSKLMLNNHTYDLNAGVYDMGYHTFILHHAVFHNQQYPKECVRIVDLLLKHGADVNAVNEYGENVLYKLITSHSWSTEVADFLFDQGASVYVVTADEDTLLLRATDVEQEDAVEWLLGHGIDIDKRSKEGKTPLYIALSKNNLSLARLLLQRGANANEKIFYNKSALHYACKDQFDANNLKVARLLLEFDAKFTTYNARGLTPFQEALSGGSDPIAFVLIEEFAKIRFREEVGASVKVRKLSDLRLIEQEHPILKKYYNNCLEELRKMNRMKLYKSVSMYDALFLKNNYELALLLKKEEFAKLFRSCKIETTFLLYGSTFSGKLEAVNKLKKSMDELDEKLYSTIGRQLPDVVMRDILKYLYWLELGF